METIRQGSTWIYTGPDTRQEKRHHVTWCKGHVLTWNEETGARNGPGTVGWSGTPEQFRAAFIPASPPCSTREGRAARARWLGL